MKLRTGSSRHRSIFAASNKKAAPTKKEKESGTRRETPSRSLFGPHLLGPKRRRVGPWRVVPAEAAFLSSILVLSLTAVASAQNRDADIFGPAPAAPPAQPKPEEKPAPPAETQAPSDQPSDTSGAPPQEGPAEPVGGTPGAGEVGPNEPTEPPTAGKETPSEPPPQGEPPAAAAADNANERDSDILGTPGEEVKFTEEATPEDPLAIGGLLYLRAQSFPLEGQPPKDWSLSAPSLLDVYLDVRPNDRVRGYVLGRMVYDPTLPPSGNDSLVATGGPLAPGAASAGTQTLNSIFAQRDRDPQVVLDQLWLRFDLDHTLFVTAGKQHVRWGTGRFWNPTDYLHLQNRNPIDVFDSRTGTSMLKLHLPIEDLAWNFYGYAVTEDVDSTDTVSEVAGALRGEFVIGTAELGLGIFARKNNKPRFAADLSFGLWDFDIYGEVALRDASEIDRVRFDPNGQAEPLMRASWETDQEFAVRSIANIVDALYPIEVEQGLKPQVVGGFSYTQKYNDVDTFTLGTEYFYNSLGYDDVRDYPGLILPHTVPLRDPATFFYLGKHYGAVFATFPAPYSLDLHTFTVSCLGNLSDQSFISRLDYSLTLLTHLTFEAFFGVHFGRTQGEFRFGVDDLTFGDPPVLTVDQPPALFDLGVALRMAI